MSKLLVKSTDKTKGIKSAPSAAQKKDAARKRKQIANLEHLLNFDYGHRFGGKSSKPKCHVIGTDEVGRGCLAGPVVACAAVLPDFNAKSDIAKQLSELDDSKKIDRRTA